MNTTDLKANIDTVVVVMFENRSFDHVLGHISHPMFGNRTDVDGVRDVTSTNWINDDGDGLKTAPFFTKDFVVNTDLPHGSAAVHTQLAWSSVRNAFGMTGFTRAYEDQFHSKLTEPPALALLEPSGAPVTTALANAYTVCDRWFACVPTSTAPNRMMSMCGDTPILETKIKLPDTDTVYDWLSRHGVRWRAYSAGLPFFALMPRLAPLILSTHFRDIDKLAADIATEDADEWPQVIFIEPDYFDSPFRSRPPCDNHAPLSMAPGERFLAQVYGTLTSNQDKWKKTALFVTYDEHGGFWDHVPPPAIHYANPNGISFDSTGPRIPVIAAGPFASKAGVCKETLDNTSLLQLFAQRFADGAYSPAVDARGAQGIASAAAALSTSAANSSVVVLSEVAVPAEPTPSGPPSVVGALFSEAARALVKAHGTEARQKFPMLEDL